MIKTQNEGVSHFGLLSTQYIQQLSHQKVLTMRWASHKIAEEIRLEQCSNNLITKTNKGFTLLLFCCWSVCLPLTAMSQCWRQLHCPLAEALAFAAGLLLPSYIFPSPVAVAQCRCRRQHHLHCQLLHIDFSAAAAACWCCCDYRWMFPFQFPVGGLQ